MLRPREAVRTLPSYHPPLAGRDGLRLDFNENVAGCSPRILEKLRRLGPELLAKYPEREPVEAAVADFLGVTREELLLTNGVDEAIHQLCQTYLEPGDEALIVVPTYSMYRIYAMAAGAQVISVPATSNFAFPAEEVRNRITARTRLIAIANPNNPTGTTVSRQELLEIARAAPNAAVLVDEAYFEFYGQTMLDGPLTLPNVFVARTFSKAYGLAGLRIGVLVGDAEQMRSVRRVSFALQRECGGAGLLAGCARGSSLRRAIRRRGQEGPGTFGTGSSSEWNLNSGPAMRISCWCVWVRLRRNPEFSWRRCGDAGY